MTEHDSAQAAIDYYRDQRDALRDELSARERAHRDLLAAASHYGEEVRLLRDELSARADDHAVLDCLRAFLADDWPQLRQAGPLLAAALGIDPGRVGIEIRKGEIRLVIRADGEGGERWDDYARARAEIDVEMLAALFDARCREQERRCDQ